MEPDCRSANLASATYYVTLKLSPKHSAYQFLQNGHDDNSAELMVLLWELNKLIYVKA